MSPPPNRLSGDGAHRFGGSEIDRSRSFTFLIDGREVKAHPGDTLLSAAIAAGITGAGTHDGQVLALDERFAPAVLLKGNMHDRLRALPMERTPVAEGLDLVTLKQAGRRKYHRRLQTLRAMLPDRRRRLNLSYDDDASLSGPWFDAARPEQIETDLVVIGGGLAGLAAALAAGKYGDRVTLIERRQWLGGDARFFGNTGDEDSIDEVVGRLTTALRTLKNVTILLRAEAFALFEGSVRVQQVVTDKDIPSSRIVTISTPRIIVASGSIERLPVFPGNRLPGVVGAVTAFNRADRFGVWIGKRALLCTSSSVGYRVAMHAKDAGVVVERIADTRLTPQSRFVEFGKAYGIPLARGVKPRAATTARGKAGLQVQLDHGEEAFEREVQNFAVDQLMVLGGWQPDLSLWHMAGGGSRWNPELQRLEAEGALNGVMLAGGVAGYRNAAACVASGQAAVARLFGRPAAAVDDPQIDPMHESLDDPTPTAPFDPEAVAGSYLDGGSSLTLRPAPPRRKAKLVWPNRRSPRWGFADQARPLSVADVVAGVQLGAIPADDAAIVAQERCVTPGDIVDAGASWPARFSDGGPATTPPAYLSGRFGPKTSVWLVEAADGRAFEVGCLVHTNADHTAPLDAVGVVFAVAPAGRTGGLAVIGKWPASDGDALVVKDISAPVPVRLVDPLKPIEMPVVLKPVTTTPLVGVAPVARPTPPVAAAPPPPPANAEAALAMIAGVNVGAVKPSTPTPPDAATAALAPSPANETAVAPPATVPAATPPAVVPPPPAIVAAVGPVGLPATAPQPQPAAIAASAPPLRESTMPPTSENAVEPPPAAEPSTGNAEVVSAGESQSPAPIRVPSDAEAGSA